MNIPRALSSIVERILREAVCQGPVTVIVQSCGSVSVVSATGRMAHMHLQRYPDHVAGTYDWRTSGETVLHDLIHTLDRLHTAREG